MALATIPEADAEQKLDDSDQDLSDNDQRAAPRYTLLIRAAKLIAPAGEFICVIRDVSSTGISIRLFHRMPSQGPFVLELQGGAQFELTPVWQEDGEAGFKFSDDVPVDTFVSEAGIYPKRGLRVGIHIPVTVCARSGRHEALIENISQQGAKLACDEMFAIDQTLELDGEGLSAVCAKVRWRGYGNYGVVFDDTFTLSGLARLAALLQAPTLLEDGAV